MCARKAFTVMLRRHTGHSSLCRGCLFPMRFLAASSGLISRASIADPVGGSPSLREVTGIACSEASLRRSTARLVSIFWFVLYNSRRYLTIIGSRMKADSSFALSCPSMWECIAPVEKEHLHTGQTFCLEFRRAPNAFLPVFAFSILQANPRRSSPTGVRPNATIARALSTRLS